MSDLPTIPVVAPLPADWREQAAQRERADSEARILERDRRVASECPRLLTDGRHRLVERTGLTFMCDIAGHGAGSSIFIALHCDGRIPNVTPIGNLHLSCPVFEIDGERYPPREGAIEPKARRKRLHHRRSAP